MDHCRKRQAETIHVRPFHPDDLDEVERMMKRIGFADSACGFRLCHTTISALTWVATNDRNEIVAFDTEQKLTIENMTLIFGLLKIVEPTYRSLGITKLFTRYFKHLPLVGHYTPLGLAAAEGGMKFGKKTIIFLGQPNSDDISSCECSSTNSDIKIRELDDVTEMDQVIAYDRTVFDYDRSAHTRLWCARNAATHPLEPFARTIMARNEQNCIVGYGTIRLLVESYTIEPLYADNDRVAECLLTELVRLHKSESVGNRLPIVIYVYADNRTMMRFAARHRLVHAESEIRTYVEEKKDGHVFRAEIIEKYIRAEKIYCAQSFWPV